MWRPDCRQKGIVVPGTLSRGPSADRIGPEPSGGVAQRSPPAANLTRSTKPISIVSHSGITNQGFPSLLPVLSISKFHERAVLG
jgi:hypothetical protein